MTLEPRFDVMCLGRLELDLCALERGARLEDATTFAKHLGGSAGSIAFGCARLGLRAAMVSRVGDDHAGRFLTATLAAEGCDVSHVSMDRERKTAMVWRGTGDETLPRVSDRESGADVEDSFIAQSRALVITESQFGSELASHFADDETARVSSLALERARRRGVRTVLAIDHRSRLASERLQAVADQFDLVVVIVVVGRDELRTADGQGDLLEALRRIRAKTSATLVLRLGAEGCAIVDGDEPARLEPEGAALAVPGFPVEVMNEVGAGAAFMAGLVKGWLTGMGWREAGRLANACGALVAARPAGAASMPTPAELETFMSGTLPARPDSDPHLTRLHRVTPRRKPWDDLCLLAFDQRRQDFELARDAGAPETRLGPLKKLLLRAVAETEQALSRHGHVGAFGAFIDDSYGADALLAATGRGLWLGRPVEVPGSSPLEFEGGRSIGSRLISWPREHVVSCLVRFDPDAPVDDRLEDETQLQALYRAILASGHELLLELMPPRSLPGDGDTIVRALKRLYNIDIFPDWWALEALSPEAWRRVDDVIAERDPWCRGVVLVGRDASVDELTAAFRGARSSRSCRGFVARAVGETRTVFREPSEAWLSGRIDDDTLVARVRAAFEELVRAWQTARKEGP